MNNSTNPSQTPYQFTPVNDTPPQPRTEYGKTDVIFAWISVLLGYIMMLARSPAEYPVGMFLFTLVCYGVTFYYVKKQGGIVGGARLTLPVSALVLNIGLLINSNETVLTLVTLYSFFAYVLWVYTAFNGEKERSPFDSYMLPGLGKALTVLPFGSFFSVFESGSQIKSAAGKKVGKTLLWILLGLVIAVIPTVAVTVLLSFDHGFSRIIDGIFEFDLSGIFRHVGSFLLGIPVAMYIFGLLYSASSGRFGRGIDRENAQRSPNPLALLPRPWSAPRLPP